MASSSISSGTKEHGKFVSAFYNALSCVTTFEEAQASQTGVDIFPFLQLPLEVFSLLVTYLDKKSLFSVLPSVCSSLNDVLKSFALWCNLLGEIYTPSQLAWLSSATALSSDGKETSKTESFFTIDYGRLAVYAPFNKNLVRNCSGQLKSMAFWALRSDEEFDPAVEITVNSVVAPGIGSRMTLEQLKATPRPDWLPIPPAPCCFATCRAMYDMEQTVDFVKEGIQPELLDRLRPPIVAGEWVIVPHSVQLIYQLEISLLNADYKTIDKKVSSHGYAEDGVDNIAGHWKPIWHTFTDYQPGVRYLRFHHSSLDPSLASNEFFASKCSGAVVKVIFPPKM